MKGPNEYHIRHNGGGIYYLDNMGLLWHENIVNDKPSRNKMSMLSIKLIAKIKITIK
jgi:hypothetical protein